MYYPAIEDVRRLAEGGAWVPVWREVVADLETPVSAFLKVNRGGPSFLLESVEGGQRLARYSFIGTEPYRTLAKRDGSGDPLEDIDREMTRRKVVGVPGLPRLAGGAVGYLAYETAGRFERLPSPSTDTLGLPEAFFMFVHTMLIFDHVTHSIKVLSHVMPEGDVDRAYAEAVDRIDDLIARLRGPLPLRTRADQGSLCEEFSLRSNFTRQGFEQAVTSAKELIAEGEAIQVVLSQRLSRRTEAAPFDIYRALRSINPSPYMFYLDCGDFQLVGASPEILVRVENGRVMTRPLAGTRRRGKTPEEDLALEQELRNDEKERAEHIMLVDLGRNDIGRVAEPGTVQVSDLMEVERYSHVMHLVTHVEGAMRGDASALDALRACFPAGTVSGAPKVRAMEIIAELEPDKRGPYAGAVGYLSYSGNLDMAITIRTIVTSNGMAHAQAGCGIVYDSVPANEYEETLNKARALTNAISRAEGRTVTTEVEHVAAHR
jgi:anthranilate synthase component 1